MKFKKETSLRKKLLKFLIIFCLAILGFLWFFQVIFLNTYYEWTKTKEIENIASKVQKAYNNNTLDSTLESLSYTEGVCIEVVDSNLNTYSIGNYSKGCFRAFPNDNNYINYRSELIKNNLNKKIYKLDNNHGNKMIIYVLKLKDNNYLIVNASLLPLNSTISILSRQLVYVSIITFILSFLLAYFIAKRISTPIVKLNNQANDMAKGNHKVIFDAKTDLLEINSLSDTLNHANQELSKTDELRRELLANVSHDLKTPLTMIKAYAEMVRDLTYNNKEKRDNNLNTIIDETNRLNLLVNDILDLSKIQSNVEVLNLEKIDLNDLIKTVIDRFRYLEDTKDYKIQYKELKDAYIYADKKKIEQVIYNLVGNATNYDKNIIVRLKENNNKYLVEVVDHGKGIDKDEIDNIWNKYYKIDKTHQRNIIGTGLGLSIVKNIFELHNIEYGVKSKKGSGTTFFFYIDKFDSIE